MNASNNDYWVVLLAAPVLLAPVRASARRTSFMGVRGRICPLAPGSGCRPRCKASRWYWHWYVFSHLSFIFVQTFLRGFDLQKLPFRWL